MLPGLFVKQIQKGLIRNSLYALLGITAFQISTDKNVPSPQKRDTQHLEGPGDSSHLSEIGDKDDK